MKMVPSSLRNRLVLGAAAVGFAFALVFGAVANWRIGHAEHQAVQATLRNRVELARDEVAADGSISQDAGSPKTDLVQVIGPDGTIRASSPALAGARPLIDVRSVQSVGGNVEARVALQHPDIDLAVLAVPLTVTGNAASPAGVGALVVAVDAEGFNTATSQLRELLVAGLGAVVLAMTALSWALTGRALTTVTRLTETAEAVGPRDLQHGLPIPDRDAELKRLVEALNRMLVRLHQSHATELAFAADAGHRLRTPVATLRAEAELALGETEPSELKAALERIVRDADQLTSIVDRMLARSRAGERIASPVRSDLADASTRWHRQAELAHVAFSLSVNEQISADAQCVELVAITEAIVDNAVRHTPTGGSVEVEARLEAGTPDVLVVTVTNTGEPIAPELIPHLFGAWASTRDASVAGGLGLWLARETARDLGGDVSHVADATFTVFRVRLPVERD